MKTRSILFVVIILLTVNSVVFADRDLGRAEILQIFQQLTNQPRETWIPAGVIEATRQEYRAPRIADSSELRSKINQKIAEFQTEPGKQVLTQNLQKMQLDAIPFNVKYELSNEYTMNSTVVVRYDGNKYYWEINVDSRTDSVKPGKDLAGNFMTDDFNLDWNSTRIFAWDGEKHMTYCPSVNRAMSDSVGDIPNAVSGPLTAGLIPWGHGYYTYDNLASVESAATEKYIDGQTQIHLTVNNSDGLQMVFVMDPSKNYALISCSWNTIGNALISREYSDYQLISGNWVPTAILLERYEAETDRLLSRDLWNIAVTDSEVPRADSFNIDYEEDTLIEYASYITEKPVMYRYSQRVDTDELLAQRLAFAASEGTQPQNCATAALKYTTGQLGKNVTDAQLAELVASPNNDTTLSAMKQFAQGLGLYCRAVKTDIDTLRTLQDCQVILHIPGKKHFVVLESIDNEYVRIINLANDRFYYRTDINFFPMDWTQGTALIISDESIAGEFTEIPDYELNNITGASGYTCTLLLQNYIPILCELVGGECLGLYRIYWERYGCEDAEEGSCTMTWFERCRTRPCIQHPQYPWHCTVPNPGEWTYYWMKACQPDSNPNPQE